MSLLQNTVSKCEVSEVSDSVTDVTEVTVVSSASIDDQAFNRTNIQKKRLQKSRISCINVLTQSFF